MKTGFVIRNAFRSTVFIYTILVILLACARKQDEITSTECTIKIDTIDFSFGMDYSDTSYYLIPGTQSDLSDSYLEEIRNIIGTPQNKIEDIVDLCNWVDQNFTFENAGGNMIGKKTVDELYEMKTYYGCHSAALIISSILRKYGFPATMIETADVQWGYDYHDGIVDHFSGHVMSEIYVENKWILLDNNGTYVEEYDPLNPYIPEANTRSKGYFVFAKGVDTWDYNGMDDSFTYDQLIFFSENIYCFEDMFYTVSYNWSN